MKPISILFVDDQVEILQIITRTLAGTGLEILSAEGGAAALEIFKARRVDVLVSDIDMPGMSGTQLLERVRVAYPRTLRMLLTGAATLERAMSAINEGEVVRIFSKPFEPTLFRATIETLAARIERLRSDEDEHSAQTRHVEFNAWLDSFYPGLRVVRRDAERRVLVDEAALKRAGHDALWKRFLA